MAKQESLTHSILKAVGITGVGIGIGALIGAYRSLDDPHSPLRAMVLERATQRVGYSAIKECPTEIDSFRYQLPGIWRTAGIAAATFAEPGTDWRSASVFRRSLVRNSAENELNPEDQLHAFYLDAKPADQQRFPGLYVVREQGEPVETIQLPLSSDSYSLATVRYFLVGQDHLPPLLRAQMPY